MGRCCSSWIIQICNQVAKQNLFVIPYSGGSYFPLDTSKWAELDPLIVRMLGDIWISTKPNFIDNFKDLRVTEQEYVMLRLISFFMPESDMSEDGLRKVNKFKLKYIDVFNAVVYQSHPHFSTLEVMNRVSQLISLLAVVEKLHYITDEIGCLVTTFNWSEMRGNLAHAMYMGGRNC